MGNRGHGRSSASLVLAAGALASWLGQACRSPTQVTLVIESPVVACASLEGVTVTVAGEPAIAEERATGAVFTAVPTECASDDQVGTLVVTPGPTGRAAVVVVAGIRRRASECTAANAYEGCVVARRTFSFIDHVPLTVPMPIDPACVDVPCDAESTCVGSACVPSELLCDDTGCSAPGAPGAGASSPDAGADSAEPQSPGDASLDDAARDSGPVPETCDPVCSPSPTGGERCAANKQVCCKTYDPSATTISCQTSCSGDRLCCVGKSDCADSSSFCCTPKGGGQDTGCRALAECTVILCRTDADCPGVNAICATGTSSVYGYCEPQ
jgi:hypothetical protein